MGELEGKMVHSQYELPTSIITEHTMMDISERAAQNLKYFAVLKDDSKAFEVRAVIRSEPKPDRATKTKKTGHDWRSRQLKRRMKVIYNRLSKFTAKTLEKKN